MQAAESLTKSPEACRIEADHDDAAFGNQHALDLAQREVRVARRLERMRQDDEVEAVALERQRIEVAMERDRGARRRRFGSARSDREGEPRSAVLRFPLTTVRLSPFPR